MKKSTWVTSLIAGVLLGGSSILILNIQDMTPTAAIASTTTPAPTSAVVSVFRATSTPWSPPATPIATQVVATTKKHEIETPTTNKRVFAIVFNPMLFNDQNLIGYTKTRMRGWKDPWYLLGAISAFFHDVSYGTMNYSIVETVVTDVWLEKEDGHTYTPSEYVQALQTGKWYQPDAVSYPKLLEQFNICAKVNNNEIDEVWIFGYPGLGLYEWVSTDMLYAFDCKRDIFIMGFNIERNLDMAIHDFGHRMETMVGIAYNGYSNQWNTQNLWGWFTSVPSLVPDRNYGGCGNIHFPPNATKDVAYDYSNVSNTVLTNCEDFKNYPNLTGAKKKGNCSMWGCTAYGFTKWWFSNIPHSNSCGSDGIYNNWWVYFANPDLVYAPTILCV
jgi:hypothetical protein